MLILWRLEIHLSSLRRVQAVDGMMQLRIIEGDFPGESDVVAPKLLIPLHRRCHLLNAQHHEEKSGMVVSIGAVVSIVAAVTVVAAAIGVFMSATLDVALLGGGVGGVKTSMKLGSVVGLEGRGNFLSLCNVMQKS